MSQDIDMNQLLSTIQCNLVVPKSKYNQFGKFVYRSAEDILEAVKPFLMEVDGTVTCHDEVVLIGSRYYVCTRAVLAVGQQSIECCGWAREDESKSKFDGAQLTGSASSYARKYALSGLFALDDGQDSDATNTGVNDSATQVVAGTFPARFKCVECGKTYKVNNAEQLKTAHCKECGCTDFDYVGQA